jgi:hypothetical protein
VCVGLFKLVEENEKVIKAITAGCKKTRLLDKKTTVLLASFFPTIINVASKPVLPFFV